MELILPIASSCSGPKCHDPEPKSRSALAKLNVPDWLIVPPVTVNLANAVTTMFETINWPPLNEKAMGQ